mmetsp:Transcript_9831/g.24844  ORF Transcript_9831/g.24844 Transcript_9831/m.24844 type:complete len:207 (-) Transcript_9831:259-879(-)
MKDWTFNRTRVRFHVGPTFRTAHMQLHSRNRLKLVYRVLLLATQGAASNLPPSSFSSSSSACSQEKVTCMLRSSRVDNSHVHYATSFRCVHPKHLCTRLPSLVCFKLHVQSQSIHLAMLESEHKDLTKAKVDHILVFVRHERPVALPDDRMPCPAKLFDQCLRNVLCYLMISLEFAAHQELQSLRCRLRGSGQDSGAAARSVDRDA